MAVPLGLSLAGVEVFPESVNVIVVVSVTSMGCLIPVEQLGLRKAGRHLLTEATAVSRNGFASSVVTSRCQGLFRVRKCFPRSCRHFLEEPSLNLNGKLDFGGTIRVRETGPDFLTEATACPRFGFAPSIVTRRRGGLFRVRKCFRLGCCHCLNEPSLNLHEMLDFGGTSRFA